MFNSYVRHNQWFMAGENYPVDQGIQQIEISLALPGWPGHPPVAMAPPEVRCSSHLKRLARPRSELLKKVWWKTP